METIASIAAAIQLIEQTLRLVQRFYHVQEAVRAAPKTIEHLEIQLSGLSRTLEGIENERSLKTAFIDEHLEHIYGVMKELNKVVFSMQKMQERGRICRYFYAMIKKPRDDAKLLDILARLVDAKSELLVRIGVTHVGITREVSLGIERIERQAHSLTERQRGGLRLEGNTAVQDSAQMNGIIGFDTASMSTAVSVTNNQAAGRSRQQNFVFGGPLSLDSFRPLNPLNKIDFS